MKKIMLALVSGILMFGLTACFDIVEEVHLERNGSGKYAINVDMSSMFKDPFMKGMMAESLQQGGAEADMEKDTMIYFKDEPKLADLDAKDRKVLEKLTMHMVMSESQEKMLIQMEFPFSNVSEIAQLTKALKNMDTGGGMGGFMGSGGMMTPGGEAAFELSKGKLKRLPMPAAEKLEEDENMAFMKMFLESANYKTIYHLPGKVKKASFSNAEVDGSTVTVTHSLLELMEGKAKLDGEIKFKQ
ncbi:MAG: hypothetical protein JNK77_13115 [Saprospiraceae bacterium]|nr:hypothetical protein [Saprospiraceae bacterium]